MIDEDAGPHIASGGQVGQAGTIERFERHFPQVTINVCGAFATGGAVT